MLSQAEHHSIHTNLFKEQSSCVRPAKISVAVFWQDEKLPAYSRSLYCWLTVQVHVCSSWLMDWQKQTLSGLQACTNLLLGYRALLQHESPSLTDQSLVFSLPSLRCQVENKTRIRLHRLDFCYCVGSPVSLVLPLLSAAFWGAASRDMSPDF